MNDHQRITIQISFIDISGLPHEAWMREVGPLWNEKSKDCGITLTSPSRLNGREPSVTGVFCAFYVKAEPFREAVGGGFPARPDHCYLLPVLGSVG